MQKVHKGNASRKRIDYQWIPLLALSGFSRGVFVFEQDKQKALRKVLHKSVVVIQKVVRKNVVVIQKVVRKSVYLFMIQS